MAAPGAKRKGCARPRLCDRGQQVDRCTHTGTATDMPPSDPYAGLVPFWMLIRCSMECSQVLHLMNDNKIHRVYLVDKNRCAPSQRGEQSRLQQCRCLLSAASDAAIGESARLVAVRQGCGPRCAWISRTLTFTVLCLLFFRQETRGHCDAERHSGVLVSHGENEARARCNAAAQHVDDIICLWCRCTGRGRFTFL